MMKIAVFVAILAFAKAAPMDDEPSLSVLPVAPQPEISLLPQFVHPEISLLPEIYQPEISLLPAQIEDLPPLGAVEIPVVHEDSPCAACFQYIVELINQLTIAVDIPVAPVPAPEKPVALPGVAPELPEISVRPLPIDVSQLQRPVFRPAVQPETRPVARPAEIKDIIF